MDDFRQAAIYAAIKLKVDEEYCTEYDVGFNDGISEVVKMLYALPSAEPQRWIPIEERPPQFGKDVLVSYRGGVMADWLTQCEGNAYFYISGVAIQDVDAWCELPEPWKGEVR